MLTPTGYLFRATSGGIMRVAGLAPVENIPGLENIDVTQFVNGHMAYRAAMPRLLREVGWEVESDEFTEIEDPDPDNHEKRQRELIRELDEARKEAESKSGKRRFGLFKRGKLARKKGWETYDDSMRDGGGGGGEGPSSPQANGADGDLAGNVLFDINAIRAELASEMIEVKQLESTLPPMKLEIHGAKSNAEWNAYNNGPPPAPPHTEPGLSDNRSMATPEARADDDRTLAMRSAPPINTNNSPQHHHANDPNPFDRGYDEYIVSPISTLRYDGDNPDNPDISNGISPLDNNHNHNPSTTSLPSPHWPAPPPPFSSSDSDLNSKTQSNPSIPIAGIPTSTTDPSILGHNAWLDEEDEFGGEKEVRMTFG